MKDGHGVYIAHSKDKIDQEVEKYINSYPEKKTLKILFLRESEGVYQFGQRRVYVKIEQGNKIVVRVGGGYLEIGEFIKQYTDLEAERISCKPNNVIMRF